MTLEEVDGIIRRLRDGVTGGAPLPGNGEVLAALAFLSRHLGQDDGTARVLAARLDEPVPRFDMALADGLLAMRERLRDNMRGCARLREEVLYVPNSIPIQERLSSVLLAVFVTVYAVFSARIDDFYIPGKRTDGLHLHGTAMWLACAASACAVLALLVVVADHYDRRNNERLYRQAGDYLRGLGWCFFVLAMLVSLVTSIRG